MVSAITTLMVAVLGLLLYVATPVLAMTAPVRIRERVGRMYLSLGAKCLKQFTFVRRVLSGYDILPISVDDEQKLLSVTLTSAKLGEDNEYRFADPDNRISRLFRKPVALAYEKIPAAVDAELAEWGHWVGEKREHEGLWHGDMGRPESLRADPYVETSDGLWLVDPIDAFELTAHDVDAENIKTAEKITKKRYEKYSDGIGLRQTARVMFGFAVGALGAIGIQYANENLIGGGGSGDAPVVGEVPMQVLPVVMDTVAVMV